MPNTKKTTKAPASPEKTRLSIQTCITSSKTKGITASNEHEQISKDDLSQCSCEKCDSYECFTLRKARQCSCKPCKGTKYCVQGHKKDHKVKKVASKKLSEIEDTKASELRKSDTKCENVEHERKNNVVENENTRTDLPKNAHNSEGEKDNTKCWKLPAIKNENKKVGLTKLPNVESFVEECVKRETTYEYINNNGVTSMKQSKNSYCSSCDHKDTTRGIDNVPSTRVTHVHSTSVVYSRKDNDFDTAKLSAQVMNVPYNEFKESISYNRPAPVEKSSQQRLSKLDIFKRIKEVYKACSCRVCECIVGKSNTTRHSYCNCKPCECNDCVSLLKNLDTKQKSKQVFIGCPCIRCDRVTECKGLIKKSEVPLEFCDCEPCEHCAGADAKSRPCFKPCDCKPCECIECKSYRTKKPSIKNTVIIGSMLEDIPRSYCQCAPCDCAECGQDYPMSSSLRHEIGTGISRPGNCACDTCMSQACESGTNNSCSCEIERKIMRKPVEKDNRDYDIHRASVKNKAKADNIHKNDTIAMFASFKNNFPRFETLKNKNNCSCGDCECIVCSCKENTATAIKASRFLEPLEDSIINKSACQCAVCDCQYCIHKNSDQCLDNDLCKCDICDCLNCVHLPKASTSTPKDCASLFKSKNWLTKNSCKCDPCECTDCNKILYNCTGDNCYCTKCKCQMCSDQTKFINETVYRNRNNCFPFSLPVAMNGQDLKKGAIIIQSRHEYPSKGVISKIEKLNTENYKKDTDPSKSSQYKSQEIDSKQRIIACEAYVQCQDQNIKLQNCNAKATDYENSASIKMGNSNNLISKKNVQLIEASSSMPTIFIHESKSTHTKNLLSNTPEFTENNILNNNYMKCNFDLKDLPAFLAREGKLEKDNKIQHQVDKWNMQKKLAEGCKEFGKAIGAENQNENGNHKTGSQNTIEITCARDMSVNLVNSLRLANNRLSNLINPNFSQNNSKIGPSKANISLPSALFKIDDISVGNYTSDLSAYNLDYDNLKNTLKQARVFSDELMKVLNEYKRANQRLEAISHKHLMLKKTSADKYLQGQAPIISATMYETIANERIREKMLSNYDPMKKYGLHNLQIEKIKQVVSDGDRNQSNGTDTDEKDFTSSKSDQNYMTIDQNVPQNIKEVSTSIGVNVKSKDDYGGTDESYQFLEKLTMHTKSTSNMQPNCSEINENKGLEKLQIKSYEYNEKNNSDRLNNKERRRSRITRSALLYKRLKLKEALVNLASNVNITTAAIVASQENNKRPKQDVEKVLIANGSQTTNRNDTECGTTPYVDYNQQFQVDIKDTLRAIATVQNTAGRNENGNQVTTTNNGNVNSIQSGQPLYRDATIQSSIDLMHNRGKSKIDLELKDFSYASSQTCNMTLSSEKAVDCMDDTFSVVLLKRQIKELIENRMNETHPLVKKSSKKDGAESSRRSLSKTGVLSKKSSYDPLKVKFHSLRKISDHTVFVKWKVPEDVGSVEGYELLVDGRTVQKIINPSRCMAVLTCLPHIDKVLITIRTIVSAAVQCAYLPTSTIVYKMRPK